MPLPSSGEIKFSQINVELTRVATAQLALGESAVRSLFGIPSGQIKMSDGYGKSNAFTATITTNQQELNLRTWALANGWNGTSTAIITIASGVYIWSNNTAVAGLTTGSPWANGLTIINNGFIIGRGGNGGTGTPANGGNGGSALSLETNCSITNNSYIAGGGGGGVGYYAGGGGGAGGGSGGNGAGGPTNLAGGAGGSIGSSGSNGTPNASFGQAGGGGGGGRVLPGVRNSENYSSGGGAGGSAGLFAFRDVTISTNFFLSGGGGGGWGASGGQGRENQNAPTGVGLGGNSNGTGTTPPTGGTPIGTSGIGGRAVQLNGFTVTWNATGTRWGAIS